MTHTVSIRLAHKSVSKAGWQIGHDMRTNTEELDYIDHERAYLNSIILPHDDPADLLAECVDLHSRRTDTKQRRRSDASVMTAGVITFGRQAQAIMDDLPRAEQDEVIRAVAEAIARKLDTRLTGLVVHRDETALHAHFGLRAVTSQGVQLTATLGRAGTSEIQDIAGATLEALGLDIHRGERRAAKRQRLIDEGVDAIEAAGAVTHRSVNQLHRSMTADLGQLVERIRQAEDEAARAQDKAAKNQRLIEEQSAKLAQGRVDEATAEKRIAIYERRAAEAERIYKEWSDKTNGLRQEHDRLKQATATLQGKHDALRDEINSMQGQLDQLRAQVRAQANSMDDILAPDNPHEMREEQHTRKPWEMD